jgi:hypothetical protein
MGHQPGHCSGERYTSGAETQHRINSHFWNSFQGEDSLAKITSLPLIVSLLVRPQLFGTVTPS